MAVPWAHPCHGWGHSVAGWHPQPALASCPPSCKICPPTPSLLSCTPHGHPLPTDTPWDPLCALVVGPGPFHRPLPAAPSSRCCQHPWVQQGRGTPRTPRAAGDGVSRWPRGCGDSQKHTCRQDRDRDMPRKRPTPRLQPGLGVGERDTGKGSGSALGKAGSQQEDGDTLRGAGRRGHPGVLGTPRGAGDTQGCRHHPATEGFLGEGGLGHRGAGDTAHAWKPGLTLARAGPLGESQGPKSLRGGGFAWRAVAAWEAVGDAGGLRVPAAPAPVPRWGPDRCAPTRAHPHRRLRHSSKRGENTPPLLLPPTSEHPKAAPVLGGPHGGARSRPCRDWCWPHRGCKERPQHSATAHGTRRGRDPPIR